MHHKARRCLLGSSPSMATSARTEKENDLSQLPIHLQLRIKCAANNSINQDSVQQVNKISTQPSSQHFKKGLLERASREDSRKEMQADSKPLNIWRVASSPFKDSRDTRSPLKNKANTLGRENGVWNTGVYKRSLDHFPYSQSPTKSKVLSPLKNKAMSPFKKTAASPLRTMSPLKRTMSPLRTMSPMKKLSDRIYRDSPFSEVRGKESNFSITGERVSRSPLKDSSNTTSQSRNLSRSTKPSRPSLSFNICNLLQLKEDEPLDPVSPNSRSQPAESHPIKTEIPTPHMPTTLTALHFDSGSASSQRYESETSRSVTPVSETNQLSVYGHYGGQFLSHPPHGTPTPVSLPINNWSSAHTAVRPAPTFGRLSPISPVETQPSPHLASLRPTNAVANPNVPAPGLSLLGRVADSVGHGYGDPATVIHLDILKAMHSPIGTLLVTGGRTPKAATTTTTSTVSRPSVGPIETSTQKSATESRHLPLKRPPEAIKSEPQWSHHYHQSSKRFSFESATEQPSADPRLQSLTRPAETPRTESPWSHLHHASHRFAVETPTNIPLADSTNHSLKRPAETPRTGSPWSHLASKKFAVDSGRPLWQEREMSANSHSPAPAPAPVYPLQDSDFVSAGVVTTVPVAAVSSEGKRPSSGVETLVSAPSPCPEYHGHINIDQSEGGPPLLVSTQEALTMMESLCAEMAIRQAKKKGLQLDLSVGHHIPGMLQCAEKSRPGSPVLLINEGFALSDPDWDDPVAKINMWQEMVNGKAQYCWYDKDGNVIRKNDKREASRAVRRKHGRYMCVFCVKRFADATDMVRHTRTHTKVTPFKCDLCELSYSQQVTLEQHRCKKHDVHKPPKGYKRPKVHTCEMCGLLFKTQDEYLEHLREHHPRHSHLRRLTDRRLFEYAQSKHGKKKSKRRAGCQSSVESIQSSLESFQATFGSGLHHTQDENSGEQS
ncbi:hypothetical protein V1264_004456 [Littorina saxatilis]|uniref:C2H2-type domain-containing protein n=1 Tax=Littorina saxatilis TaxID=31220 RepID=A0AAN9B2G3_9CAEN